MVRKHQDDPNAGSFFLDAGPGGSTLLSKKSFDEPVQTPIPEIHVQPAALHSEIDPNARRAERLHQQDAGGGFASAVEGDLDPAIPAEVTEKALDITKQRLFEVPGVNRGRNNWYNQPATRAEKLKGMSGAEIDAQDETNTRGYAAAKEIIRLGLK